jgi:hypothetical protein
MSEQLNLIPDAPQGRGHCGARFVEDDTPFDAARCASSAGLDKQTLPARRGLPPMAYVYGALVVAALLWGAWVTKNILDPGIIRAPIASVRLEQLIGEYVQAQARSNTPPENVAREMEAFMAALGAELKARGADGTTVMVGEAVLSQNVPDITADVRRSVYAKVPAPSAPAAPPASFTPPRQTARAEETLPVPVQ